MGTKNQIAVIVYWVLIDDQFFANENAEQNQTFRDTDKVKNIMFLSYFGKYINQDKYNIKTRYDNRIGQWVCVAEDCEEHNDIDDAENLC